MNIQAFTPGKIEELKTFYKQNANAPSYKRKNCILMDNTQQPHLEQEVYCCDHWNLKNLRCLGGVIKFGGCKRLNSLNLDAVIEELTRRW